TPEPFPELRAHLVDQPLGVKRRCPGDDRLDWPKEIPGCNLAYGPDIVSPQCFQDFFEQTERVLAGLPFRLGAEQIFFGNHLQDRPDVLGHSPVNEYQALLQLLAQFRRGAPPRENVVLREESPPADAEFRVPW